MSVQVCSGCGQQLAWGLFQCPRCSTVAPLYAGRVKEEAMPRITVAGGPSNAAAGPGEVGFVAAAAAEEAPVTVEIRGEHGPELDISNLPEGHVNVLRSYASMTLAELREEARRQEKPTSGSKADLVARLDGDGVGQVVPEEVSA